jgi:hypothetical protein
MSSLHVLVMWEMHFLYGTTCKLVYIFAGPEFGPELEGKACH